MRILIITLLFMGICSNVFAEKRYVYIDKVGTVYKGQEAGQTEYGDVVAMCPYTKQYKPTRAELERYRVFVVDVAEEDRNALTAPIYDKEDAQKVTVSRKLKVDLDSDDIKDLKQEQTIEKSLIFNNVIDKSESLSDSL